MQKFMQKLQTSYDAVTITYIIKRKEPVFNIFLSLSVLISLLSSYILFYHQYGDNIKISKLSQIFSQTPDLDFPNLSLKFFSISQMRWTQILITHFIFQISLPSAIFLVKALPFSQFPRLKSY